MHFLHLFLPVHHFNKFSNVVLKKLPLNFVYSFAAFHANLKMEALTKSTVHIKDRDEVQEIVSQLIKGGATKLQVIADFDYTLSRAHKNGAPCDTTYSVIEFSPLLSEECRKQALALHDKYYPIEIDPHMTVEERMPYEIEWDTQVIVNIKKAKISKDMLAEMVAVSSLSLRDDCDVMFKSLNEHHVPLMIFSAGQGDVIKEVLEKEQLLIPNVKFKANLFSYDENNRVDGLAGPPIRTFNKSQSSIENHEYFEVRSRNNIILLGDSLSDLDMAAGVKEVNVMLKIGFVNCKIEENLPKYLDKFDIVLTDDQTMDVVVGLLKHIL